MLVGIGANAQLATIGIDRSEFAPHYRPQQQLMWCWASSAEMILSYEGIDLPQQAIVTRIMGAPVNAPGNLYQIVAATNLVLPDAAGVQTVVSGQFVQGAPVPAVVFTQLSHKRPVILTYSAGPATGHAVVLTAIDYRPTSRGPDILRFYVFDPFSYSQRMDIAGHPYLAPDPGLQYKVYSVQSTPGGVALMDSGRVVGTITGMLLIDAAPM